MKAQLNMTLSRSSVLRSYQSFNLNRFYNLMNSVAFGNSLPNIGSGIFVGYRRMTPRKRGHARNLRDKGFEILISQNLVSISGEDISARSLATLIHEMAHVSEMMNHPLGRSGHGPNWRTIFRSAYLAFAEYLANSEIAQVESVLLDKSFICEFVACCQASSAAQAGRRDPKEGYKYTLTCPHCGFQRGVGRLTKKYRAAMSGTIPHTRCDHGRTLSGLLCYNNLEIRVNR